MKHNTRLRCGEPGTGVLVVLGRIAAGRPSTAGKLIRHGHAEFQAEAFDEACVDKDVAPGLVLHVPAVELLHARGIAVVVVRALARADLGFRPGDQLLPCFVCRHALRRPFPDIDRQIRREIARGARVSVVVRLPSACREDRRAA